MKHIAARKLIIVLIAFFTVLTAQAQPEENGGDPPNNDVPLDGGVSLLIAAGVGYGVKRIRDEKQRRKNNQD